jgi:hypothetical protein
MPSYEDLLRLVPREEILIVDFGSMRRVNPEDSEYQVHVGHMYLTLAQVD